MNINIEFTHFWHCGSGRSGGKKVDAMVEKDMLDLPFVPGKTLKGILREAVRQAEGFNQFQSFIDNQQNTLEDILFGSREQSRDQQFSGILAVSDARLSQAECSYLKTNPEKISLLYRDLSRTAIDNKTGTAIDGSLRAQEVTIPMTLTAELDIMLIPVRDSNLSEMREKITTNLIEIISLSLPYVDGIGALRQRGLGRCILTLEE